MINNTFELVVIGGGPAGLSAAIEAARLGVETTLIDENMRPGGQLFKQIHKFFGSHRHFAGMRGYKIGEILLEEIKNLEINTYLNTPVIGVFNDNTIGIYRNGKVSFMKAKSIVIATGAVENPLSFKGWTLPGVMGAGAVQTMVNVNGVLPGKKVLMVGSGNVGLIVSYQLIQAGAELVGIVEIKKEISGWHVHAAKIKRLGVPFYFSHTVVEATGDDSVRGAVIAEVDENYAVKGDTRKELEVDLICIAVGLRPLIEVALMAGCHIDYVSGLGGFLPVHNEFMMTTKENILVAGDITGIEEASTAMEEGRLAGLSAAHLLGKINRKIFLYNSEEINTNLAELRKGTFGYRIREDKERIFKRFSEIKGS